MKKKVIALMSLMILNLALYLCESMNAPVSFFILMEYVDEIQVLFHQNTIDGKLCYILVISVGENEI
jgi:type IV secretory pathway VirB6-like protein